jgi:hypothetical protein
MTLYCPKCHGEFEAWVSLCPDCQARLVDELPEEQHPPGAPSEGDALVPVGSAPNEVVARIWIQILEESGIRSVMQSGRPMSGLLGDFSLNVPCDIYVFESEADRAAEILESLLEEENTLPDEEGDPFRRQ